MAVRKKNAEGIDIYPLDIAALEKGDHIPVEMCEPYTKSRDRNNKAYSLELEQLKEKIEKRLQDLGRNWTLSCPRGGISILTDAEAATENKRRFDLHVRGMGRRLRKNMGVDASPLDSDTRKSHEHNIISMTMQVSACKRARRQVTLSACKRTTPKLGKL
jgi:hypothetical protein